MIRIFGNYYDKNGNKYKIVSFNGDKYACESFRNGKIVWLKGNELFSKLPKKSEKVNFVNAVIKKEPIIEEKAEIKTILEPKYETPVYEEPVYENQDNLISKEEVLKDNIKETADNDFYADL